MDLHRSLLRHGLDPSVAADMIWTLTSVSVWDDLVARRGWTDGQYRAHVTGLLVSALVAGA